MSEYTPDTEDVAFCYEGPDLDAGERRAAFYRWLAGIIRDAKAEAWDEGHSWGWSDAQEAHDVRQHTDRADWKLHTPNPYRERIDDE